MAVFMGCFMKATIIKAVSVAILKNAVFIDLQWSAFA